MEKLTAQEEETMLLIWKAEPCFVKEVWTMLDEPRMPYTTLASVFKNLERKGFITGNRRTNSYEYHSLISKDEYQRSFLGNVVSRYFGNSYKRMVSFFAREEKLSEDDLKDILKMLDDKNDESK